MYTRHSRRRLALLCLSRPVHAPPFRVTFENARCRRLMVQRECRTRSRQEQQEQQKEHLQQRKDLELLVEAVLILARHHLAHPPGARLLVQALKHAGVGPRPDLLASLVPGPLAEQRIQPLVSLS